MINEQSSLPPPCNGVSPLPQSNNHVNCENNSVTNVPQTVQSGVEVWICRSCTFENQADAESCLLCYVVKSKDLWACASCTYHNSITRKKCEVCGERNDAAKGYNLGGKSKGGSGKQQLNINKKANKTIEKFQHHDLITSIEDDKVENENYYGIEQPPTVENSPEGNHQTYVHVPIIKSKRNNSSSLQDNQPSSEEVIPTYFSPKQSNDLKRPHSDLVYQDNDDSPANLPNYFTSSKSSSSNAQKLQPNELNHQNQKESNHPHEGKNEKLIQRKKTSMNPVVATDSEEQFELSKQLMKLQNEVFHQQVQLLHRFRDKKR